MTGVAVDDIWVYLSASPLLGLTVTLLAYLGAHRLYEASHSHPLLHPVAVAVAALIGFLVATGIPYQAYFDGAQFVHFLLGPATVALAVPLYRQTARLQRLWLPMLLALATGISVATLSAVAVAALLGAGDQATLSLAPKSVTAPVAMGISERIGGLPSLTAVLVVATGILGAAVGPRLLERLGVDDDSVRGVALGVTSHGIGTARAFQIGSEAGAFSGLAMALSALASAALVPWLLSLAGWLR
jgi:predicted murein hydrolase (TIGR00659 family)